MASADKSPVAKAAKMAGASDKAAIDFLPDADEIERRPLPGGARMTMHVVLAAMVTFFIWAFVSEVDMIVVARGRLVTPVPNIVVQPLETAIIQSIDVRVGQVVRKGDKLAALDATFVQADESQLKSKLASLDTQWASLEAALSGAPVASLKEDTSDGNIQSRLSDERRASYQSQIRRQSELIAKLRSTLETARRDEQALDQRVKVLSEMESMTDDLFTKKLAVKGRLLDAKDRLLEAERSKEAAKNRQIELRRELSAVEAEKSSFETSWRQKLLEELLIVSRERDALKDQLQKASRRESMVVLTAPADAVVLEIAKLSQGSIVREAETFFTLVPIGDVLEAQLEIGSHDIGYIKVSAATNVKVDAFPFQKHGMLDGRLKTVSQDSFRRDPNSASSEAFYTGRVTIDKLQLDNMPPEAKLLPGMTMTAEIMVGKRSVMSYLLWPLTKAAKESIREP